MPNCCVDIISIQPHRARVIPKTSSPISTPTPRHRGEIGRIAEDEESRRRDGVHLGLLARLSRQFINRAMTN